MLGKKHKAMVALGVVLLALTSCTTPSHTMVTESKKVNETAEKFRVGVSIMDLENPYFVQIVEGIKREATLQNVELIINDPKSNVSDQIKAVEEFTSMGVDAIIIAALDQEALEDSLSNAMAQGIKVVAQATKVDNCNIYVSFSEWDMGYTIGQAAGQWILENLGGKAEVAILNYPQISQIARREKGIWDGITEYAPNATLMAVASAANPTDGKVATLEILKKNPNVQVIIGINDGGALGAYEAFKSLGRINDMLFIGGIDATPEAIKMIKENSIYQATVDNSPFHSGELDLDFAVKLIRGQIVPDAHVENAKIVTIQNILIYE